MTTIKSIFNEITENNVLVEKSLYFVSNNKMVRVSDHAAKYYNVLENNSEVSEILLVFVNANMTENEMQANCDELSKELNINVEYVYHNDNEDTDTTFTVNMAKRFLN